MGVNNFDKGDGSGVLVDEEQGWMVKMPWWLRNTVKLKEKGEIYRVN